MGALAEAPVACVVLAAAHAYASQLLAVASIARLPLLCCDGRVRRRRHHIRQLVKDKGNKGEIRRGRRRVCRRGAGGEHAVLYTSHLMFVVVVAAALRVLNPRPHRDPAPAAGLHLLMYCMRRAYIANPAVALNPLLLALF